MSVPKQQIIDKTDKKIEAFSIALPWLRGANGLRLDAGFYNPRVADALALLNRSGLPLQPLSEVTKRVFIPPRFKRIYVEKEHGVPFLQGSHVVHFQPADIKYLSRAAHKRLDRWIIESGWVLVTCSGTIGRVTVAPPSWDGWAASQHILRIVPDNDGACPAGYVYAYLCSELGQAQLTSRIYGAVVDEITEEQARSVLIPVPTTIQEKKAIREIDRIAKESMLMKDGAVKLAQQSVECIASLVPELKSKKETEDYDVDIARERLAEIKAVPEHLVRGKELRRRLERLEP
ncbi:MAG: restriction endonuclease subunit S [Anaerolineae bacterium]|nr:restriction endonuclease subunit S [Anaerolineae bacterium]